MMGSSCTAEVCVGFCIFPARDCSDANPCTADSCSEGQNRCLHNQLATGATCDDGNPFTFGERCNQLGTCRVIGSSECLFDADTRVAITELVTGVGLALSGALPTASPSFDVNANDRIEVNELVTGVNHALAGCPGVCPVDGSSIGCQAVQNNATCNGRCTAASGCTLPCFQAIESSCARAEQNTACDATRPRNS
jgi:hypothetical protein